MKPKTLVTVFGFPDIVIANDSRGPGPAGHIRVEYKTPTGHVRAYLPAEHVKERK
jgi:hypothetical protein